MQPGRPRTSGLGVPPLLLAWWVGWVARVRSTNGVLVLSCPSAALRVHVCAASWATWLLFTGVPAQCVASVAVSWATWLLFTGVPARCVVLRVRCPGPLGSCSPVCSLGALFRLCGVLGHLAPVHRVPASCVVLLVRCPGPLGSCSPVCPLGTLCCVCRVLGHVAPVHRCARLVRCFAFAVSWATPLLFTGVPARRVVLRVRCRGPLGSGSPLCPLGVLCCVYGVQCPLALVHRCARLVCCVASAVSSATWILFTGVPARCVALPVRCPGPLDSCPPVCPLGVLPVCAVSWASGGLSQLSKCSPTKDGATVECVGSVVRVSLSPPFSAILAGLVGSGSG